MIGKADRRLSGGRRLSQHMEELRQLGQVVQHKMGAGSAEGLLRPAAGGPARLRGEGLVLHLAQAQDGAALDYPHRPHPGADPLLDVGDGVPHLHGVLHTGDLQRLQVFKDHVGIAYTLMRVAVLMIRRDPVGAVEEVIRNGVLLGVLHIFWDRRSKIAVVIKAVFMLGFTYDILQFFAISLEDLRKGVLWSPILSAAVFAAAAAAILRLIRWQNARIDRTNEEIRRRNQQIDQQTDAQNRQIILRNQELTRQYNQLDLQLKRLRGQLSQLTSGGWYPKNQGTDGYFYSVQGIQDLIDALEGPRANSMQEALDYIGTRDYRAQSLAYQEAILRSNSQIAINQQELARNQRFANLLTCGQILLQVQQNAAIHRMEQQQRDFYRTRQR